MIFNINSTRGQNAGPHVRSTGNLSSLYKLALSSSIIWCQVDIYMVIFEVVQRTKIPVEAGRKVAFHLKHSSKSTLILSSCIDLFDEDKHPEKAVLDIFTGRKVNVSNAKEIATTQMRA